MPANMEPAGIVYQYKHQGIRVYPLVYPHTTPIVATVGAPHNPLACGPHEYSRVLRHGGAPFFVIRLLTVYRVQRRL